MLYPQTNEEKKEYGEWFMIRNGIRKTFIIIVILILIGQVAQSTEEYNLSGYVSNINGDVLGGVQVNNGFYKNTTSTNGFYLITGLPNGTYNFSYYKKGYYISYLPVTISGKDNTTANLKLQAEPVAKDTVAPVITLRGPNPVSVETGSSYTDAGATALDDVDGNITSSIITVNHVKTAVVGTYTVTYNVKDSNNNNADQKTRTVNVVDTKKPVITVLGPNPATVESGSSYTDAGATASDNVDGSIAVTKTGTVNTSKVGTYTITYTATDSSSNTATASRTVNVKYTNKPPVQAPIGPKSVSEQNILSFTVSATDPEHDPITYSTNAKGYLNPSTGQFTWTPTYGDQGIYTWTFTSTDSSKGAASETITVTVNDVLLNIIFSEPTASPTTQIGQGMWFRISLNRAANVTWYIDDSIVNKSSNVAESGYYNKTIGVGTHTVKVIASDGYDSVSRTWGWAVDGGTGKIHNKNTGINYNTIQAAIDDPLTLDGHTILVDPVTYNENVIVGKRLTIRSEPAGAAITSNKNDTIFKVTVPYVNISGFSISGAKDTGSKIAGIYLTNAAHHSTISNNEVTTSNYGIYLDASSSNILDHNNISNNQGVPNEFCFLDTCIPLYGTSSGHGIYLTNSNNNKIIHNKANSNYIDGIYLTNSHNNTLTDNNANSNTENGIYLNNSNKNNLTSNIMDGNKYNFKLDANSDSDLNNKIDTSNKVDGKPIYYLNGAINTIYDSSKNVGTFYCINCANITIKEQDLKNNGVGILLWNSSNARIYNNNLTGNQKQAIVNGGNGNVFNLTSETGGNYWSDYTGTDANSDGIGDTPYVIIAGVQDAYPYIKANGWKLPRELSIKINGGESLTLVSNVTLNLSAKNANEMRFKNESGDWTGWEPFNSTKLWTLSGGSGLKTVYFEANNSAGTSVPAKDEIMLGGSGGNTGSSGSSGSSGGSGGGGGGGGSGENYSNIEVIEKYDLAIYKDKLTSYIFKDNRNPIRFVNITGDVNAGEITSMIEVLRGTSTLLDVAAPGLVYKNENIWIGTTSFAARKSMKDAVIRFRVENSWMADNNIQSEDISIFKWGGIWNKLETKEVGEDDSYHYFEAKTDSFSHFAISALKGGGGPVGGGIFPVSVPKQTPAQEVKTYVLPYRGTTEKAPGAEGFEVILTVAAFSMLYVLWHRRR
ncbi:MAG: PGF-pre-PGF domain-containing protein [Candidatus Methanoperedens sp.]|nr:PGF-pre-PGF domain-containing protein [Candidatus Methanoperedens sp.]